MTTMNIGTRVVIEVAAANEEDPTDLPRLGSQLDVDALERLCASLADEDRQDEKEYSFRFTYAGRDVRIKDGTVTVEKSGRR